MPHLNQTHASKQSTENKGDDNNIKVCIRIRPLLPSDTVQHENNEKRVTRSASVKGVRHASGLITPNTRSAAVNRDAAASNTNIATEPAWLSPTPQTIHQNPSVKVDNSMSGKSDVAYTFDRVYGPQSSNEELYEESVRGVVENCVGGFHGSVFAYGQVSLD